MRRWSRWFAAAGVLLWLAGWSALPVQAAERFTLVRTSAGIRVAWDAAVQAQGVAVRGELRNDRGEHLGDLEVVACLPDGRDGCLARERVLLPGLVKVGETASFAVRLPRPAGPLPATLQLQVYYRLVDEDGVGAQGSFTVSGPLPAP